MAVPTPRPNSFSVSWTRGLEDVPTYENAPNDPHAVSYKIVHSTKDDTYDLRCDALTEHFSSHTVCDSKDKKGNNKGSIELFRHSVGHAPPESFAEISAIRYKKLNLTQKDPGIRLLTSHGPVLLTVQRGGYCSFENIESKTEYYWQLRYFDRMLGERGPPKVKDAVLRKAIKNEKSTMVGIYVPAQIKSHATEESIDNSPADDAKDLGCLLIRTDLNGFDKDMTLVSFVGVLLRVIEAERKRKFGHGFINALTIGET